MTVPAPEIRINARLVGEDAKRFTELQKREGLSASDLLREALREYHHARAALLELVPEQGHMGPLRKA